MLATYKQELIKKAFEFEMKSIKNLASEKNPYWETLKKMDLWEVVEDAVEDALTKIEEVF